MLSKSTSTCFKELAVAFPCILCALAIMACLLVKGTLRVAAYQNPLLEHIIHAIILSSPLISIYTIAVGVWLFRKQTSLCLIIWLAFIPVFLTTLYLVAYLLYGVQG
jgi:hypothetical protein